MTLDRRIFGTRRNDMSPMQLMELVDMLNTDSLLDWATGLDQ